MDIAEVQTLEPARHGRGIISFVVTAGSAQVYKEGVAVGARVTRSHTGISTRSGQLHRAGSGNPCLHHLSTGCLRLYMLYFLVKLGVLD